MTVKQTLGDWDEDIRVKKQTIASRVVTTPPGGERYEALVPDTLDLAARGALALSCLTGMMEPDLGFATYEAAYYDASPPFMRTQCGAMDIGKTVEALPLARLMSGSTQGLDVEHELMLQVMAQSWDNGLFYVAPAEGHPWIDPQHGGLVNMGTIGRLLRGMVFYHEYNGSPLWKEHARKIFATIRDKLVRYDGAEYAYFPLLQLDAEFGEATRYLPRSGYPAGLKDTGAFPSADVCVLGFFLLGVARYAALTGDAEATEMARKMVNTLRNSNYWALADPGGSATRGLIETRGVAAADRAHFGGHFHEYVLGLRGMLECGMVANDADVKELARSGYEFARNFGIADIGFFPELFAPPNERGESCCVADMVILAAKLSIAGIGDYWEDVDRYVRNQLTEWQMTDRAQIERCVAGAGPHRATPPGETEERVIDRSFGAFSCLPSITHYPSPWLTSSCCTQNGAQALYQAWEGIVQDKGEGAAQVNLLLNRASPQVDIASYLPYEGRAVIKNKTARSVSVRIPNWVSRPDLRCHVDTQSVANQWLSNYLVFDGVEPGAQITIEFPMVEQTIRRTFAATGVTYTIHRRGNTVLDISPRDEESAQGIQDGALMLDRAGLFTVADLELKNATVSVDVEVQAGATTQVGIVLRHKSDWERVTAVYDLRSLKPAIAFQEDVGFGDWTATFRSRVIAEDLGNKISMTARLEGADASFTVTDGAKTFTTSYEIRDRHTAGGVGVYASTFTARPVRYRNFRVSDPDGKTVFEDRFEGAEGPPAGWQDYAPFSYRFYQRNHLRRDKAPMVKRTVYSPDKVVKP